MRKSYIVLSLILSQALCADTNTSVIADFSGKNGGTSTDGKLKPTEIKENSSSDATSSDWSGSTTLLSVKKDNLSFGFTSNSETNLILNNGFTFTNKIPQDDAGSPTTANITITKTNGLLTTLTIGSSSSTSTSSYVNVGSNINLKVTSFTNVNVANNLSIASNSTFDVSEIDNVTNDGGIVLEGQDSTLKVKDTLTNNGTILMRNNSKIESVSNLSIDTSSSSDTPQPQGSIIVQGSAEISSGDKDLTITNQNITIQNLASKNKTDSSKTDFYQATLTLSSTKASGSLTLGESGKAVNISGELSKTDKTITNLEGTSEIGKLVLSGFTTINATNVNFKNVNVTSTTTTSMSLQSGTLGLENTTIAIGDDKTSTNVAFGVSGTSTITLSGQNTISTTGALTITGTHNFQGDGTLDFVGSSVNLGNGTGSTFALIGSSDSPTIGVSGTTINTNYFTLTGLTLQAIGSKQTDSQEIKSSITNTKMILSDSTLEAIDSEGNLADLTITKNSTTGEINIANGTSATLKGEGITLTEQNINLNDGSDKLTTITLQAGGNGVTIDGGANDSTISGKNTTITNNVLNLNTPLFTLKGKVTLDKLTINTNQDLTIVGTDVESGTNKGLFFVNSTTIEAKANGENQYHSLTFISDFTENNSAKSENQAYISFGSDTTLKASSFTFQNQKINLAGASTGQGLNLYAYGNESSSGTPQGSGSFTFTNTTFTNGSTSDLSLYAGSQGVVLSASKLTLDGVGLNACKINGLSEKVSLDLSSKNEIDELGIVALGGVSVNANSILSGFYDENKNSLQGISTNLSVGDSSKSGQLTITSTDLSDTFIFGGNLTLDNTAGGTTLKITSNGKTASTSETSNELKLEFRGGGVTAIGTSTNTVTLKAKDFTFSNLMDSNNAITSTPFVKVQNTELNLNGTNSTLDLVGTLYLSGTTTNEAKFKASNGGAVKVTLHDINVEGKASVTENQLEFSNSNIFAGVLRDENGNPTTTMGDFAIKDSVATDTLSGTIASITLDSGALKFQNNTSTDASITLNAGSTITSSGTSSLTLKTIKVGKDSSGNDGLYSLNITNGTFTLKESTAGNQLGAITLGSESSQGGSGGSFIYQNGSSGNAIELKGNITSYGNSSIQAQNFTISAKEDKSKYTISSNGGELKLIAQVSSNPTLSATADISLNSGSLGYYGSANTLSSLSLSSSSSVSATGDSTLQADKLDLGGASVSASGGTLTLKGISSSTTAGNVSVGDSGILTLKNSNTTLASLTLSEGSKLTLSANVPYVTSDEPLGGGVFGQVIAQSVQFESKSGGLVQISLKTSSASSSSYDDSLFALREGAITLIDTKDGITKKQTNASYTNITLDDIVTDTSGLTSITLTPYLQSGTNTQGQTIEAQKLLLNLSVSQTNVTQLVESIKDSSAKETMTSIIKSGNNASILESILQSDSNAFKVGMAEYISSGNTAVVQTSLEYINGAMSSLEDSMFASNKIYELIAMLRTSNVENRMVRGKNPFMAKTQLSSLIRSISGTRYASSDDSLLLEEEESGVNYGELWANFDGAMSFSQEEKGNSSLYGMSAGYDTLLGEQRNYLLGFFASYGYGAYSFNYARNNSHNFGLGLYTRMSFENSEVDIILSQNIGLNHTEIDLGATNSYVAQALKQTLGYNFYTTDIEARYGYVFKVGNEDSPYYFRPFGGINFALIINSSARGDGEAELGIQAMSTYQLSVNVGVEMRKYFGEENYFYLLPILQKGLLNDGAGAKVGFYGAENLQLTPNYNVDTSLSLLLGGVGNVGENIAVSGGVGVKYGFEKKDILTNWNVGIRYKF